MSRYKSRIILSLLLCFALLFALVSCGADKKEARIPLNAGSPEQFGMIRDNSGDYRPSSLSWDELKNIKSSPDVVSLKTYALQVVSAQKLQTPICLMKYLEESGEAYYINPGMEEFTTNPDEAKTLLYVIKNHWSENELFAVSKTTGNAYLCLDENGAYQCLYYISDKTEDELDKVLCEWILEQYEISNQEEHTISQQLENLDADQEILKPSNIRSVLESTYGILTGYYFEEAKLHYALEMGLGTEDIDAAMDMAYSQDTKRELDANGNLITAKELADFGSILIVDRNNEQGHEYGSIPTWYEYPSYEEWIQTAAVTYIVPDCNDMWNLRAEQPRYVLVAEIIGYEHIGEFSEIGDVFAKVIRYTLTDVDTGSVVAWSQGYHDPVFESDELFLESGGSMRTGQKYEYISSAAYAVDASDHKVVRDIYGGSWQSVLGIDEANTICFTIQ